MVILTRLFTTAKDRAAYPELFAPTDHDPATRTRTRPMRVLILGMPRTGTLSLTVALEKLGFGPAYHMVDWIRNPRDGVWWARATEAKYAGQCKETDDAIALMRAMVPAEEKEQGAPLHYSEASGSKALTMSKQDWDRLLGNNEVVIDVPGIAFLPELIKAYPEAKVIVAQRDAQKWLHSYMGTVGTLDARKAQGFLSLIPDAYARLHPFVVTAMICGLFGGKIPSNMTPKDTQRTIKQYNKIYDEIRRLVPEDKRLDWTLAEGWEPLCKFLGVEKVPTTPFPHVNDTTEFLRRITVRKYMVLDSIISAWLPRIAMLGLAIGIARRAWPSSWR